MHSHSPRTLWILVASLATIAALPLTAGRAFNLTRPLPPKISAAFNPSSIALNATTNLTYTITNPNEAAALIGVTFLDTMPAGLKVAGASATSPTTTNVCGGRLELVTGGINLAGATINANSQCQFSVKVTGGAVGQFTTLSSHVMSVNGLGLGNTATANLTVVRPRQSRRR